MSSLSRRVFGAALALSLTACVSGSGAPPTPLPGSGSNDGGDGYPEGPYGTSVGAVIANMDFNGYARPADGLGESKQITIQLADFYNPEGDGVYPEGSPYGAGTPLPLGVMLNVGAGWCGPCKDEAQNLLPGEYAKFHPQGMELLAIIAEGQVQGVPATFDDLHLWIQAFGVDYPVAIDPAGNAGTLFDASAFPGNLIIDTRDMSIIEVVSGIPGESFWSKLEQTIETHDD